MSVACLIGITIFYLVFLIAWIMEYKTGDFGIKNQYVSKDMLVVVLLFITWIFYIINPLDIGNIVLMIFTGCVIFLVIGLQFDCDYFLYVSMLLFFVCIIFTTFMFRELSGIK